MNDAAGLGEAQMTFGNSRLCCFDMGILGITPPPFALRPTYLEASWVISGTALEQMHHGQSAEDGPQHRRLNQEHSDPDRIAAAKDLRELRNHSRNSFKVDQFRDNLFVTREQHVCSYPRRFLAQQDVSASISKQ